MTNTFGKDVCFYERTGSDLTQIFRPVSRDLQAVQQRLTATLSNAQDPAVREIIEFLLESPGKRIRPALVLLSAGAAGRKSNDPPEARRPSVDLAAAVEMIHMASLIHDDLIDGATVRHHRSSIHVAWGKRISVAVGDYLCAHAFRLVADCTAPRLFAILGCQLCEMCEGEMQQVTDRGDFALSERHCLAMMEKKTAALFRACCGVGAATAGSRPEACQALQEFGFQFGIAFQMLDDCRDLSADRGGLGKTPGQDLLAGDVTLPLLYTISYWGQNGEKSPPPWDRSVRSSTGLARVRAAFHSSPAPARMARLIASHVNRARQALQSIADSDFKDSLRHLADEVAVSASRILAR
jgi:geranylgeranyl pyrophosphate synthase